MELAAERALLLFGCYRKGDANDPDVYSAAITAVLADYEEEVIIAVTDPRIGIARQMKFIPSVAELSDYCDARKASIEAERQLKARGYIWNGERYVKEGETNG